MGIRFQCHYCEHSLHVKDFQAGRRGKCPNCDGAFRIPDRDAKRSLSIDESVPDAALVTTRARSGSGSGSALPEPKSKVSASPSNVQPTTSRPHVEVSKRDSQRTDSTKTETTKTGVTKSDLSKTEFPVVDLPPSLIPLLDAQWYVSPPTGGQYGPATTRMLVEWIAEHRVTPESHLRRDGTSEWIIARDVVPEAFAPTDMGMEALPPVTQPHSVTPDAELAKEASRGSLAAVKASVSNRRKRQRIRTWLVLGLLLTIALSLTITLIVVLWR